MSYAHTEVAHIAAVSANCCIGKDNQLPWHLPADLQHFKRMTTDQTDAYVDSGIKGIVIMGRKTFESMGKRPLPKRVNFILTSQLDYAEVHGLVGREDVQIVHNLDDALTLAANLAHGLKFSTIWVIGGEKLFAHSMMYVDRIELTLVDTHIADGDAFYPELSSDFHEVEQSELMTDTDSGLDYRFVTYQRR